MEHLKCLIYQCANTFPNNVKSISFWIKDYECLNDNWLLESDLNGSNRMALTAGGTPENTLKYLVQTQKEYIDGIEHTITEQLDIEQ